jgi:hypothetical protein
MVNYEPPKFTLNDVLKEILHKLEHAERIYNEFETTNIQAALQQKLAFINQVNGLLSLLYNKYPCYLEGVETTFYGLNLSSNLVNKLKELH